MKIYDCFMYFDEDLILEIRLNYLSNFIDKFIIIESSFNHRGEKRNPQFNINKFEKFKDKIEYILIEEQPQNIEKINAVEDNNSKSFKFIMNAVKQENFQRNMIMRGLKNCADEDWIIVSDLDEIPNLNNIKFEKTKKKLIFFKQHMIYYKFNLILENFIWVGSKACKKKYLKSPQWLRNIKDRSYPWWRIDAFFSEKKYQNLELIEEGGWHFTNIKKPEEIEKKMRSYLHHHEYDLNPLGIQKIKQLIKERKALYNIKTDMRLSKFDDHPNLKLLDLNKLPNYIYDNQDKFTDWIEK